MNTFKVGLLLAALTALFLAVGYFIGGPQMEKQKQEALLKQQQTQQAQPQSPAQTGQPGAQVSPTTPPVPGAPTPPEQQQAREAAVAASPRITVETSHLKGSISLRDRSAGILCSGDTLFRGAWGRTDLPGGDADAMLDELTGE